MTGHRFTPEAEDDLFEIWCYIARDSVAAGGVRRLRCLRLSCSEASERWSARARHCLSTTFLDREQYPNYVVVYRPETHPLEIIRVLHGMRDLKQLLKP
jgi:plasmid stabilization system protein ParE